MKKIIFFLISFILIVFLHNLTLDSSLKIALKYSTPYEETMGANSGEFPNEPVDASSYEKIIYETNKTIFFLKKRQHHSKYIEDYVNPLQNKIKTVANITFSIIYIEFLIFLIFILYKWMSINEKFNLFFLKKIFKPYCFVLLKIKNTGIKNILMRGRLNYAEKEFNRLKNFYDNGLISEDEFIQKKDEIKNKIKKSDFLN
jgi:hypothetical protein